ncbi:hypothetical protein AVEN_264272-1 [Araneus ventricosus]|uniref:CCHC-type domain-containing protein n=1 Tax=Araneus ventricosus TaxID=182803 RepID=A0A4Y2QY88_ARAVE|nr:hypothetical protein AVEN_264272-1 [Araneus ventricosus]
MNDSKFVDKSSIKYPTDNVTFVAKYKKLMCNFCSKKGHTSKFYRLKASKCFSFGKAGHYKRDCPASKTTADSGARHSANEITFSAGTINEEKFIIASGATSHMCSRKEWFSSLEPASEIIKCASKSAVLQLLSVQKIEAAGFCVVLKKEEVFLEKENKCLLFGHRKNCGQYISGFIPHCETALKSIIDDLRHRRCGHSCNQSLKQLGLPTISSFCEVCTRAKQCATPVGKGPRKRETVPMVMIHTDICEPIVPKTFAGEQYFMTLINDYSRFTEVRLLKRKSDAASELKNFCQLNPSVKKIRRDNGKDIRGIPIEFTSDNLFLDQESYVLRWLKKHKMLDFNPSPIPIDTKATAVTFEKGNHFNGSYRELFGSLLYYGMYLDLIFYLLLIA